MRKRWELHATPWTGYAGSTALAESINRNPERYWTKRGVANAIHFWADTLGLPVTFWVRDLREAGDR